MTKKQSNPNNISNFCIAIRHPSLWNGVLVIYGEGKWN